jgi:hypothetical protein
MLISTAVSSGQSQLLTNPATLSQFPSVDRVRAATLGTDDVDSHARFIAALYRINDIIIRDLVTAPNGGVYDVPPAADAVHGRYSREITRNSIDAVPPAGRDPRFRALEDKYEKDPAFFDGLLTQLFSPKFRVDYYAWVRRPVPALTSGLGGATRAASLDPSIAKAKTFKMDTSVFGMELGQPLSLPACTAGLFKNAADPTCVNDPNAATGNPLVDLLMGTIGLAQQPNAKKDPLSHEFTISLDADHCPSWVVPGCQATALVYEGQLVAVAVSTNGRKVENSVNSELRAKYGPPNLTRDGRITPDAGNAFDVHEPIWLGRGIRVEYQVVVHNEDVGVDTRVGWVRIMTETAYDRLYNKPIKRKL